MRVGDAPLRLLRAVRGIDLVDLPDDETCCGFGGTFSLKNPDVSAAMGADKVSAVLQTGAQVLCSSDNSCLMHIGGVLPASGRGGHHASRRDPGEYREPRRPAGEQVSGP